MHTPLPDDDITRESAASADATPDSAAPPEQGSLFAPTRKPRRRRVLPSFAAGDRPRRRRHLPWRALLAALGLALALLFQIVLADRARLAAGAGWRPWLARLCGTLGCDLPPWREPQAFTLTSRDVRPHPSAASALLITATFRNDAEFEQAWPTLELSLSDLDGRPVALRRFTPVEYLGSVPATPALSPGQSANVTLEVLDPGKAAVAFAFEFR